MVLAPICWPSLAWLSVLDGGNGVSECGRQTKTSHGAIPKQLLKKKNAPAKP